MALEWMESERRLQVERDKEQTIENLKNSGIYYTSNGEPIENLSLMSLSIIESYLKLR